MSDIKNELFFVKNMLEKKEYDKAQDKIDNILLDCFKIYSPSICTNIYVDSFLSRFINTHSQIDFDIKIDHNYTFCLPHTPIFSTTKYFSENQFYNFL